jgi:1-acyl-sn-glycerol-3-phosphate acyltransferase
MIRKNIFYSLNLFVRSSIFSILMLIVTILYSFICLAAFPFPLRYRYKLVSIYTSAILWLLKVICRINYQIEGVENISKNRSGVVLSKHQSTWETFFLQGLFHQAAIILKRELLWIPFFGWGLATIDPIAINRSNMSRAMHQIIIKGRKCLEAGRWILVFPEGTRTPPGKVGHYRIGGARLAVATGYPVIPVAHNAGYFWPKRSFIKTPGTIRVVIGPVIKTEGRPAEEVLAKAKYWIEETMLGLVPLQK